MALTDAERSKVALLLPGVQAKYLQYRRHAEAEGIRECVTQTYRTVQQQHKKVAQKRSTNLIGWHPLRRGIDRFIWDPIAQRWDNEAIKIDLYLKANRIAETHGFRQIGFNDDGTKRILTGNIWDPFHIEWRHPWDTLVAAIEAEAPELLATA